MAKNYGIKAYEQNDYTPVPQPFTRFMRTCVIWQFIKFCIINIKMILVVRKSHH